MAHYKRDRSTTRKELKRIEHKSARQAEKDALDGNLRQPTTLGWSKRPMSREKNLPLLDGTLPRKPHKKNRKKWCKGKVGRPHKPVYKTIRDYGFYRYGGYVCEGCGRHMWGHKPPAHPTPKHVNDHWSMSNIQLRLAGHPCPCESCRATE